ncbi:MFS transporter [Streptomyces viridiviolaceus]|uniref:MFS transporter n=1 Tax=Streptomyces viridiviolaceus TaxID=68282 RepID=A0ABW2DRI8_9ACTN|nr:MFS transporter [Streptomyces viridiviolaceus]GHB32715.1 MFS transporter [Streptomyces viridiviolaceus]
MKHPAGSTGETPTGESADLAARLDRLPVMLPHVVWISILTVNLMLEYYDNALFAYIIPAIKESTGLGLGRIGMVSTAFFIGMVLGGLVGGRLSDRFGRRWVLVWGTALYSSGAVLTMFAPNYELLLVSRVITGIGVQAAGAALLVYIAEMFPSATRGRFMSVVTSAFVIIAPVVALLALVVIPDGGPDTWRHLFGVGGAIGLLIAPVVRFCMPESVRWCASRGRMPEAADTVGKLEARALRRGPLAEPRAAPAGTESPPVRRILRNKRTIRTTAVLSVGFFGSTLGLYLFQNWALYVLVDGLAYTKGHAYEIQLIWNLVYAVTPFLALLFIDRAERKTAVFVLSVVAAVPLVAFGLATESRLVTATGGLCGIVTGLVVTVYYAYIPEALPTAARGLGSGVIKSVGHCGGAAAGVLGAALYGGWGNTGLMAVAAASYIVFALPVLFFGPRTTNRPLEGVAAEEPSTTEGVRT